MVQVKSTDRVVKSPSVRLRRDTASYFHDLDQPVLVALYQAPTSQLFVRWFHEFDPYDGGLGKKWITFRFDGDDSRQLASIHREHRRRQGYTNPILPKYLRRPT